FLPAVRRAHLLPKPPVDRAGESPSSRSRDNCSVDVAAFEPGALIGGYRLGPLLGQGATGVVFSAEAMADPGRTVALKLLRPERTSDGVARRRFVRGARPLPA